MTSRTVPILLLGAILLLGLAGATGLAAAKKGGVGLDCVGHTGGAAYLTDSGLTVYENASNVTFGSFPDNETVVFQNGTVAVSAAGNASVRLENASGNATCLSDLNASAHSITVTPDDAGSYTFMGNATGLSFREVVYDGNDSTTDLAYAASQNLSVRLPAPGLAENFTVEAVNASGTILGTGSVAGNDTVVIELPTGSHHVDFRSAACIDQQVAGLDGQVSLAEIQQAIHWWADTEPVPDTGGETIDLAKMMHLINDWAKGQPTTC